MIPFKQYFVMIGAVAVAGCSAQHASTPTAATTAPVVKTLTTSVPAVTRVVIGQWRAAGSLNGPMKIYRSKGKFYLQRHLADGTREEQPLRPFQHRLGQAFRAPKPSSKFWIIDRDGDLQSWNGNGYIGVARRG